VGLEAVPGDGCRLMELFQPTATARDRKQGKGEKARKAEQTWRDEDEAAGGKITRTRMPMFHLLRPRLHPTATESMVGIYHDVGGNQPTAGLFARSERRTAIRERNKAPQSRRCCSLHTAGRRVPPSARSPLRAQCVPTKIQYRQMLIDLHWSTVVTRGSPGN
jgi:hypothetical protein